MKDIIKHINEIMDTFQKESQTMLKKGFPWAVVFSFHEVFRYLHLVEPYIDGFSIKDSEKPHFILNQIKKQLSFYATVENTFTPYKNMKCDLYNSKKTHSIEESTSKLYGNLWENFDGKTIIEEAQTILRNKLQSSDFKLNDLKGKLVLDLGCGSGRYSIALSTYGCKKIIGYDMGDQGISFGNSMVKNLKIKNLLFQKGNVLDLPFDDNHFDFIFCNGVLHHTTDMIKAIHELYRVLKPEAKAFLYLYGAEGIFWNFRKMARNVFNKIPRDYAQTALDQLGVPMNRFIFMDTWYVPIERHTTREKLEKILSEEVGFKKIKKIFSKNKTDLETYIESNRPYAKDLYGDGEHRYILTK